MEAAEGKTQADVMVASAAGAPLSGLASMKMSEARWANLDIDAIITWDERLQVLNGYHTELDLSHSIDEYEYCIIFPLEYGGLDPARIAACRQSQVEIIQSLRKLKLLVRLIKTRDGDELLVLVRAPTLDEWCYVPFHIPDAVSGVNRTGELMDWYAFWADKLKPEYLLREARDGLKHATFPYSFKHRHTFVREGEHNFPDTVVPLNPPPSEERMPGFRNPRPRDAAAEAAATAAKHDARLAAAAAAAGALTARTIRPAAWDLSVEAYMRFVRGRAARGCASPTYETWAVQTARLGGLRAAARREFLLARVVEAGLKRHLVRTWFAVDDSELRTLRELSRNLVIRDALPLHQGAILNLLYQAWPAVAPSASASGRGEGRHSGLRWLLSRLAWAAGVGRGRVRLDEVSGYFMEETAFFFDWVRCYNRWLVTPSVLGIGVFIYNTINSPITSDSPAVMIYALFIAAWSTTFLARWRRRQASLAHIWSTDGAGGVAAEEEPRPDFVGELRYSVWLGGAEAVATGSGSGRYRGLASLLFRAQRLVAMVGWTGALLLSVGATAGLASALLARRDTLEGDSAPAEAAAADRAKKVAGDGGLRAAGWLSGGAVSMGAVAAASAILLDPIHSKLATAAAWSANRRTQSAHDSSLGWRLFVQRAAGAYLLLLACGLYGRAGVPCSAGSEADLLERQCEELVAAGHGGEALQATGCSATPQDPTNENGVLLATPVNAEEALRSALAEARISLTVEQRQDPSLVCLQGTTIHFLAVVFMSTFFLRFIPFCGQFLRTFAFGLHFMALSLIMRVVVWPWAEDFWQWLIASLARIRALRSRVDRLNRMWARRHPTTPGAASGVSTADEGRLIHQQHGNDDDGVAASSKLKVVAGEGGRWARLSRAPALAVESLRRLPLRWMPRWRDISRTDHNAAAAAASGVQSQSGPAGKVAATSRGRRGSTALEALRNSVGEAVIAARRASVAGIASAEAAAAAAAAASSPATVVKSRSSQAANLSIRRASLGLPQALPNDNTSLTALESGRIEGSGDPFKEAANEDAWGGNGGKASTGNASRVRWDEESERRLKQLLSMSMNECEASRQARRQIFQPLREYDDYIVQFGFIALFGGVFPLAPLLGLLHNIWVLNEAARRCANRSRRPRFRRVQHIMLWVQVLDILTTASVVVNLLICGLSSYSMQSLFLGLRSRAEALRNVTRGNQVAKGALRAPAGLSERGADFRDKAAVVWIMLLLEHLILGLKRLYAEAAGDVPGWVERSRDGIATMRRTIMLRDAFGITENESSSHRIESSQGGGPEQEHDDPASRRVVGMVGGAFTRVLFNDLRAGRVENIWREMSAAPKERRAPQSNSTKHTLETASSSRGAEPGSAADIFFKASMAGGGGVGGSGQHKDDKGLPVKLDEVLERKARREIVAANLAAPVSKNQLTSRVVAKSQQSSPRLHSTARLEPVGRRGSALGSADAISSGPAACLHVRVLEVVRPHLFRTSPGADSILLARHLAVGVEVDEPVAIGAESGPASRRAQTRSADGLSSHAPSWAEEELVLELPRLPVRGHPSQPFAPSPPELAEALHSNSARQISACLWSIWPDGLGTAIPAKTGEDCKGTTSRVEVPGQRKLAMARFGVTDQDDWLLPSGRTKTNLERRQVVLDKPKDDWFALEPEGPKSITGTSRAGGSVHLQMRLTRLINGRPANEAANEAAAAAEKEREAAAAARVTAASLEYKAAVRALEMAESAGPPERHSGSEASTEDDNPELAQCLLEFRADSGRCGGLEAMGLEKARMGDVGLSLTGGGVEGDHEDEGVLVAAVDPRSAAALGGVQPGDRVVEVDGQDVKHADVLEIRRMLIGPPGSRITITLLRREGHRRRRRRRELQLEEKSLHDRQLRLVLTRRIPEAPAAPAELLSVEGDPSDFDESSVDLLKRLASALRTRLFWAMVEEQPRGPLSLQDLVRAWKEGVVTRRSLVLCGDAGVPEWTEVSRVPSLAFFLPMASRLADSDVRALLRGPVVPSLGVPKLTDAGGGSLRRQQSKASSTWC